MSDTDPQIPPRHRRRFDGRQGRGGRRAEADADRVDRDYQRHESRPAEKLLEMLLGRMEAETGVARGNARAFVTGASGAAYAEVIGARYVQEVAALALAVESAATRTRGR